MQRFTVGGVCIHRKGVEEMYKLVLARATQKMFWEPSVLNSGYPALPSPTVGGSSVRWPN